MSKLQLGVIYGSRSCEHEVAIISALQLMRNVNREKYDVIPVYISQSGVWYTGDVLMDMKTYTPFDPYNKGLKKVHLDLTAGSGALLHFAPKKGLFGGMTQEVVAHLDCVIPVMHGAHGEDGTLQGLLEMANLPYTSTGVLGSSIGLDKVAMKHYFRGMQFPVLPDCTPTRAAWHEDPEKVMDMIEEKLGYPVFVKPASLGSSIGVSRADNRDKLRDALELGYSYDRRVLVEKGLDKPVEVNCSVLGFDDEVRTSVLEMPNTGSDFLDFAEKYLMGSGSKGMASLKRIIPAPIGDEMTEKIQNLSKQVFEALDCKGVVRIDYIIDKSTDTLYINEINTIPGSFAYYLWEPKGITYPELLDKLIDFAIKAHNESKNNEYAYDSEILSRYGQGHGGVKK